MVGSANILSNNRFVDSKIRLVIFLILSLGDRKVEYICYLIIRSIILLNGKGLVVGTTTAD